MLWLWAWVLLWQVNQLLAQYRLGAKSAWYWSYYISFYSAAFIFIWPITNYLFPLLNELYKKKEKAKIKQLFSLLFIGSAIFGVLWAVGSYFFAEPIAMFIFGEQLKYSGTLFMHFSPFLFTLPLMGILYQNLASQWFVKERFTYLLLAIVVNIFSSYFLVRIHGVIWLVYWQVCWNIVLVLLGAYHYKKHSIHL